MSEKKQMKDVTSRKMQAPTKRVAIIGASYAGLSLANLLLSTNNSATTTIELVIIEALHPPSPGALVGNLRVPNAKRLYDQLGWKYPFSKTGTARDENESVVPEDELMQALRKPVVSKTLYRHACYKVEAAGLHDDDDNSKTNCRQLSLWLWNRQTDMRERYPHAVDVIVICTGVRSQWWRHGIPSSLDDRILIMGDAASTMDPFGQRRIRQGANQAMQDAMNVAALLLLLRKSEWCSTGDGCYWNGFGLRVKRRAMLQQRLLFLLGVVFVAVAAWLVQNW